VTWDVIMARGAVGIAGTGFLYWLAGTDGPWVLRGAMVLAAAWAAKRYIVFDRVRDIPIASHRLARVDADALLANLLTVDAEFARTQTPAQLTYSPTYQARGDVQPAQPGATLPAPTIAAIPPSEWLPWFDSRPHGLLAAETGGGKSTTAKAIIGSRIERGEQVFLLDPHSSDWFGLPSIGGGEDWGVVWMGMQVVIAEYTRRMRYRDDYLKQHGVELPHDHFPRLTVLLDEANTACRKLDVAKRGTESPWERFAEALGSGARKVNMSILMLAQSPNVEDIGLSGPMRQNFTRLALDASTTRLMVQKEETDPARKPLLLEALRGQPYPATALQQGRVVLLDRTGLDLVRQPAQPSRALWDEGYSRVESLLKVREARRAEPQRPTVAQARDDGAVRASVPVPGAIVYPAGVASKNAKIAWLLRQKYTYRQIERELSVSHATIATVAAAMQRGAGRAS
jgi:hypothetical protein